MRRTGNIGNLLEKDASGVGEERLLRTGPTILYDLSPDGGLALVGSSVGLQLVPVDGKEEPVPLAPESSISLHGRFSPDGRHIAYTSGETGRREIYVRAVPPASGKWQISSGGGGYPVWRRDGRELFYVSLDARMMSVDVIAGAVFRWGVPRTLFSGAPSSEQMGPLNGSYDVTADGQRFLFFERADEGSDSSLVVVQNWFAGLKR